MSSNLEHNINKPSIKINLITASYLNSVKYKSDVYIKNKIKLFNIINYKISNFLEKNAMMWALNGRSEYCFIFYKNDSIYDGYTIMDNENKNQKIHESLVLPDFWEKNSYVYDLMTTIYNDLIYIYNPLGYLIYSTNMNNIISWYIKW